MSMPVKLGEVAADHAGPRQRCGSRCLRDRTTPRIRQRGSSQSTDPESAETPGDHEQHREYRGAPGESRRMDEMQMGYHRPQLLSD
jgi:hypothetical protein